jgi:putative endonuclease
MTPYHFCYVYVLQSLRYGGLYIGYTNDLRKRLIQHNRGASHYTNRFKPWRLVYYEAFGKAEAAQRREAALKHNGNPMRELKKRIGLDAKAKVVRGFTLIETLVAISLLTIAVVAPIALTAQSLQSAYYARDQITGYYLAQEAIEAVRSIRDAQILQISQTPQGPATSGLNIFGSIPLNDQPFTIDARKADPAQAIVTCNGTCPPLQTNGTLYGYEPADSSWTNTNFTRTVKAAFVGSGQDEVRVTVTVAWRTGSIQTRTFSISENMYRWVQDGSGAH